MHSPVLVVDDDPVSRARVAFLLRRAGYEVVAVESAEEALQILGHQSFRLIITDWSMPGMEGPTLCARIREREDPHYTYLILLTGRSEKSAITEGLEAGADDYVTKPFDSGELLARLRVGERILTLQDGMMEKERALRELAIRDGLTGVLNRRAIDDALRGAHSYFFRHAKPLSVALLDIDFFKKVNDTYGHQAGDGVLKDVACRVSQAVRSYDSVGRFGGEEFLILLPATLADEGYRVAERIRKVIAETAVDFEALRIPVTVSIGLATAEPGYNGSIESIVEAADASLYEAKRTGRNRVIARILANSTPDLRLVAQ